MAQPSLSLFEAVTSKDYDTIADLYADNARRTIVSFLAMRNRWSPFVGVERSGMFKKSSGCHVENVPVSYGKKQNFFLSRTEFGCILQKMNVQSTHVNNKTLDINTN